MTTEQLFDLIKPIWSEDLRLRQQHHAFQMRSVDAKCAEKGIGSSGAHLGMALQTSVEESRVRARLARNVLRKAMLQTQSSGSYEELRATYLNLITNMYSDVDRLMRSVLQLGPIDRDKLNGYMRALSDEQVAAINKEIAELALFAATPETLAQQQAPGVVVRGPRVWAISLVILFMKR